MAMDVEFLEIDEHARIVHTEDYEGWPEGRSTQTTSFEESDGTTTMTVEIEYRTQEARDGALQPGFAEGYESSYVQLDALLAELRTDS